jgi:hypothetical protein
MTIRSEVTRDAGQPRRWIRWQGLGRADVGEWCSLLDAQTASVHVAKLPAGARIVIEGSHEERPSEGVVLMEIEDVSLRALPVVPRWVRPVLVADAGAKVARSALVIVGAL